MASRTSVTSPNGRASVLRLHQRVERFAEASSDLEDHLFAVKWLGNDGAHADATLEPRTSSTPSSSSTTSSSRSLTGPRSEEEGFRDRNQNKVSEAESVMRLDLTKALLVLSLCCLVSVGGLLARSACTGSRGHEREGTRNEEPPV